ncbi:SDR family NAD(P)-dependent oxidoreductase, partial [Rhodopirellula bahusiensis]
MKPSADLKGKRALVTGASRGIGRAIALELAARGASVAINFLKSEEQAVQVATEISNSGGAVMLVRADVSSKEDVEAMVECVAQKWGGLDIVVSNAAAGGFRDLDDLTPVNFEAVLRSNSAPVV